MDNKFQVNFIQRLKQLLPETINLPDEIVEILQVSQDSVYRRLRGDTSMSVDEAIKLCNHYKIPLAYFTDEIPGLVNFRYSPSEGTKETFLKHMQMLHRASDSLLDHDDRRIIYGALDAPLFHQFAFEKLAIFKMHFWMNAILGVEDFKEYYDVKDVDREFVTLSNKIHETYLDIPTDEIWPEDIMNTTLKQIEYYWELGYFQKAEDALEILDQLKNLSENAELMAVASHKLKPGDKMKQQYAEFNLYQSDVLLGNNTVLAIADNKKTAYISHMTFNVLATSSENYTAHTEIWLNRIISKANLISGSSAKSRSIFFKNLDQCIDNTIQKIKKKK